MAGTARYSLLLLLLTFLVSSPRLLRKTTCIRTKALIVNGQKWCRSCIFDDGKGGVGPILYDLCLFAGPFPMWRLVQVYGTVSICKFIFSFALFYYY